MVLPAHRMADGIGAQRQAVGRGVARQLAAVLVEDGDGHFAVCGIGVDHQMIPGTAQRHRLDHAAGVFRSERHQTIPPPFCQGDGDLLLRHVSAVCGGDRRVVQPPLVADRQRAVGHAQDAAGIVGVRPVGDRGRAVLAAIPDAAVAAVDQLDVDRSVVAALERPFLGRRSGEAEMRDQAQELAAAREDRHVVELREAPALGPDLRVVDLIGSHHQLRLRPLLHVAAGRQVHQAPALAGVFVGPLVKRQVLAGGRVEGQGTRVAAGQHRVPGIEVPVQAVGRVGRVVAPAVGSPASQHVVAVVRVFGLRVVDHARTVKEREHDIQDS